jgi:uncharacterized protein CbrC (UPF0167 family)
MSETGGDELSDMTVKTEVTVRCEIEPAVEPSASQPTTASGFAETTTLLDFSAGAPIFVRVTNLPDFRYHPDPVGSGSVVASPASCVCCGTARGFIYVGPVYTEADISDALCPWCIADGSAAAKYDATFVDAEALDDDVAVEMLRTITERTPGFAAWRSERWPSCCDEPAAFLTPVGATEIQSRFPRLEGALMSYIVYELGLSGGAANRMLQSLQRDHAPTAFVFQCLHCDAMPVYIDTL